MRRGVFAGLVTFAMTVAGWGAEPGSVRTTAYEQVIAPILEARCAECHGEQKQKAKLAVHTWEALWKGSDGGPVIVAGKPSESTLLQRLQLPVADEEHMPPADHSQPGAGEISLISRWLEHGASKTATLDDLQLSPVLATAAAELPVVLAALPRRHGAAEQLWEFDAAAVAQQRRPLAAAVQTLQGRFPGALTYESRTSAALHFTAVGFGRTFDDKALAELAAVAKHVVVLDISGSGVTDASAAVLASFTQLRVLRAGFTAVGDQMVQRLASLGQLESLSLPGTQVTAASVSDLGKIKNLRSLRVAGTGVEESARAANLPVTPSAAELLAPIEGLSVPETKLP